MQVRGFHHLAIQVHEVEKTAAWYRDVLDLVEQERFVRADGTLRSIWLGIPGGFLALEHTDEPPASVPFRHERPGHHLLALRIDRAGRDALREELEAKGVAIEHQTRWTVYVRDPEGNRIGLSHHPEDPSV